MSKENSGDRINKSVSTPGLHSQNSTEENLNLGKVVAGPIPDEGNQLKNSKRRKPLFEWRWIGQPIQENRPSPSELRYRSDAIEAILPRNVKFYENISRARLGASKIGKLHVTLGDTVQLATGEEKLPLIGLVTRMMEDNSTNRKFIRVRWLLRWDCLESDLVLAGEEQPLEDMFSDAIQMIPEDRRYLSGQNELFETDAFDDVDFSCILGKVSVDSGIGSSTTNPVDHLLPRYVCRFSLSASPDEKLKLKLRADLVRLGESLQTVETQHEVELETAAASPEHVGVKELPNHELMLKPNNDDPEVIAFHDHHVNRIRQQHQGKTELSLQQQDQLKSFKQQPKEVQHLVMVAQPIRTRVFVNVSNGCKLSMLIDIVVATVKNVKLRVDSCTGIKPSYQRVIMAGRELGDNSQALYSLGLSPEKPYLDVYLCSPVGDDYQAVLPPLCPNDISGNNTEYDDDGLGEAAVLVWPGNQQLSDNIDVNGSSSVVVEDFLQKVKEDAAMLREGTLVHVRRRSVPKGGGGEGTTILKYGDDSTGTDAESGDIKVEWSRVAYRTFVSGSPVACDAGWKENDEGIIVVNPEDIITVSTEPDEDVMLELLFKANWDVKEALKTVRKMSDIASDDVNLWSREEVSSMLKCLRIESAMCIDGDDSTLELEMMRAAAPKKSRSELLKFLYRFGQDSCHIDTYEGRESSSLPPATTKNVSEAIQSVPDTTFSSRNENFVQELRSSLPQDAYAYIQHITNHYFTRFQEEREKSDEWF